MHKLIDIHNHIQFSAFDANREDVIERARQNNIKMVCSGTNFKTSQAAIELALMHKNDILATVGFHSNHLNEDWHFDKQELKSPDKEIFSAESLGKLAKNESVIAIGEVGLDYYRLTNPQKEKLAQQKALEEIIKIAIRLNKPLVIHCRPQKNTNDAYSDLLAILKNQNFNGKLILHFFAGDIATAKEFFGLDQNHLAFTFGGVITFSRDYDDLIKYLPFENIFLETDAPYITPEPYRGKPNEPSYIIETAKKLAEVKNISVEKLSKIQEENFYKMFSRRFWV